MQLEPAIGIPCGGACNVTAYIIIKQLSGNRKGMINQVPTKELTQASYRGVEHAATSSHHRARSCGAQWHWKGRFLECLHFWSLWHPAHHALRCQPSACADCRGGDQLLA